VFGTTEKRKNESGRERRKKKTIKTEEIRSGKNTGKKDVNEQVETISPMQFF
jgi:hypothetical protein